MDNQRISPLGLCIWLICALFFTYEFLLRTLLGTFQPSIMHDLQLNWVTFAIISSTSYQLIYGLMQIPVGIIIDRFGVKKALSFAALVCSFSVFGFSMTHDFTSALVMRIIMGFGSSFGFICLLSAVYDWLPSHRIAFFIGLSQFMGTLGPMLAAGPISALAISSAISWQQVFVILFGIGLLIACLVIFFVKNRTRHIKTFQVLNGSKSLRADLLDLIRQPQVWYIAVYSGAVYFIVEYLSENSGKAFLMLNGFSSNISSYMITFCWLGFAFGSPLLGFLSDKLSNRNHLMTLSACLCLVSVLTIFYYPINASVVFAAFFLLGFGASAQSIAFAIMAEQCSARYLSAGLGLNNGMIFLFGSLFSPVVGWTLSLLSPSDGPTLSTYQHAFIIPVGLILIGFFLSLFFIKETFCKSTKDVTVLSTS